MKRFLLVGVLGALLCALALSANAAPKLDTKIPAKVPLVTRDNFVSLELFRRENSKSEGVWLRLDNSGLRIKFRQSQQNSSGFVSVAPTQYSWSEPAAMSRNQMESAVKFLNAAQLPRLTGNYHRGKSSVDGFGEVLVLTISDAKDRDQKFEIQNSIDAPPRVYRQVVDYLRDLQTQKFSGIELPIPQSDWITRDNFNSLTLETSGGFAGIHSIFEIRTPPMTSSDSTIKLRLSQTIGGREATKNGALRFDEFDQLILLLNSARFSNLNGKNFKQKNLADGFNELLTLTLDNGIKFTVSNYGDTAPAEYSAIIQYLNELENRKFPATQ